MTSLTRTVQQPKEGGQLLVTIPKQLAMLHDIKKGTVLEFDYLSLNDIKTGELNLDEILFVVKKGKR